MSKSFPRPKAPPPPPSAARGSRLNQRDLDSSCYRLSRVRGQYTISKAVKSTPDESFAITYFSQNPIDTRPPQQKLDSIEESLADPNLSRDDRFALLVQKRTLFQLLHGESSPEFVRASTELGAFYNSVSKADSASRNLTRATQFATQTELPDEDAFALAVELADANLNAGCATKLEKAKQVALADVQLSPYAAYESPNARASFRRDLCLARIRSFRTKWEESLAFYEKAAAGFAAAHPAEGAPDAEGTALEEANICVEAAQVAERVPGGAKAEGFYRRAYELYNEIGYEEDAARIEGRIGEAPVRQAAAEEEAPAQPEAEADAEAAPEAEEN